MSLIKFQQEEQLAIIRLNRPKVYNSFNRALALELQGLLDQCAQDDQIRAVLITGEGKAFCAGQDLQEIIAEDGPDISKILKEHLNPIVRQIRLLEKPVIAAVNGVAAGAGASLALCCDITVATEKAAFIQAFSKIGLIPDSGGTFFLPRLVGFQRASALMMLGDKVMADEAQQMGMIYKVFPADSFWQDSLDLAVKISKMPTRGLALTKKALNEAMENDLFQQLELEDELQTKAANTHDYWEGVQAFIEKRHPKFKGK